MMSHLEQAYAYDIQIRAQNDGAQRDGAVILAEDVGEGVVYDRGGVRITAFDVGSAATRLIALVAAPARNMTSPDFALRFTAVV